MLVHTAIWKWILGFIVMMIGAAIAVPLYRYADQDDAPGGMVIAFLIFVVGTVVATWIVKPRERSGHASSQGKGV